MTRPLLLLLLLLRTACGNMRLAVELLTRTQQCTRQEAALQLQHPRSYTHAHLL
jgi:hypothetical protein